MLVSAVFIQGSIIMLIIIACDCMPVVRLIVNSGERAGGYPFGFNRLAPMCVARRDLFRLY
ncbi:hypothetical protein A8A12_05865 [Serratia marcescens]|nr:hypothetical protein A8A12_05865 [Serratia marcescens]